MPQSLRTYKTCSTKAALTPVWTYPMPQDPYTVLFCSISNRLIRQNVGPPTQWQPGVLVSSRSSGTAVPHVCPPNAADDTDQIGRLAIGPLQVFVACAPRPSVPCFPSARVHIRRRSRIGRQVFCPEKSLSIPHLIRYHRRQDEPHSRHALQQPYLLVLTKHLLNTFLAAPDTLPQMPQMLQFQLPRHPYIPHGADSCSISLPSFSPHLPPLPLYYPRRSGGFLSSVPKK